jgi:hypothetical protein
MGGILKPDMKSLVWMGIGFIVLPRLLGAVLKK